MIHNIVTSLLTNQLLERLLMMSIIIVDAQASATDGGGDLFEKNKKVRICIFVNNTEVYLSDNIEIE